MIFHPLALKGAYLIEPEPFSDERGMFFRFYCKKEFEKINHTKEWVQLNHSITNNTGAIRGMHYQQPPFTEIKMVKCIRGKILDVIIDIRKDSPTFLNWYGAELSETNKLMMYIPEGFAHGFQSLTDDCHLIYHHSEYYAPGVESGLRYNDPMVNIEWPLPSTIVSKRDKDHPLLTNQFKGIEI